MGIKLSNVGQRQSDVKEFRDKLVAALGNEFYTFDSMQFLLYKVLCQISPVNSSLKNTPESIEIACKKVLKHLGLPLKFSITKYTDNGWKKEKIADKTGTEDFLKWILDVVELPSNIYNDLFSKVNTDLIELTKLIAWYEEQACIRKYLAENEIPKLHSDRVIFDFYKRCLAEREIVLNFQLFGLKKRVREKCGSASAWIQRIGLSHMFSDRHYYYGATPSSIHYFDSRKIDLVGHRLIDYPDDVEELEKFYYSDKSKFYKKFFKKFPIVQHFQDIEFYLKYAPLKNNRDVIFNELIRLFKGKRWISFYALALPQIEGLFSEMCDAVSPDKDLSQKSLTHKVNLMRPHHPLSKSYFDYFQYYIPLQRNKFSHTGFDENFQLKSYDLLVDLSHVLKIFCELDNPLVKVKKLLLRRNYEDFKTISEFSIYIEMLLALKPNQYTKLLSEITVFEREFLSQDCGLEYTCNELKLNLTKKLTSVIDSINKTKPGEIVFDLNKINKRTMEEKFKDPKIFKLWKYFFISQSKEIQELENYRILLKNHTRFLPSLNQSIKADLDKLFSQYGKQLNLLNDIQQLISKDED